MFHVWLRPPGALPIIYIIHTMIVIKENLKKKTNKNKT